MTSKFEIAIVGQGIAGSLMAWFLYNAGKKVLIIDDRFSGSSSKVAAGIVNPITGKNYVTSWRIKEFLPFAKKTYESMNEYFGFQCFTQTNIIRSLYTVADENTWLAKSSDPELHEYICNKVDLGKYEGKVVQQFGYGEIMGTFYVNMGMIMDAIKQKWTASQSYLTEKFEYHLLKKHSGGYQYKDFSFDEIIFCEGYKASYNPYFSQLNLAPSKGEVLIVKIPDANFSKMYKDGIFFVPQGDDIYWVGSGYEWNAPNDNPTQKNFDILNQELKRVLKIPFEIIGHKAAIRPTIHNRRPVLLTHPSMNGMFLFNGLGTKGASIGPFAANQFVRYILEKNPADLILI